ncbi:hypothetical protein MICAB_5570032 [Microcystis aeruginosa PCC 9717]|uniref:Uncharacterized protein n=1 Tax=Microcystis aeruginosa PCC 9717 TaxID=1160286 RepID=I4FTH2_MICAE|nr:hypothetical protein MICAB_5570032 [Microcystis aeruginosa PCC 9717]
MGGLSWGSINVEGETLPLQTRIAEGHQFPACSGLFQLK